MIVDRFTTPRLSVHGWRRTLEDAPLRAALERALAGILTDPVLAHLPPSLQLHEAGGGIAGWIDARAAESEVLLVERREGGALVGLVLLAQGEEIQARRSLHIGYLLAESAWGQGLASELVSGLVAAVEGAGRLRLLGGVDRDNPASARVLQKAGFEIDPTLSTAELDMFVLERG